MNSCWDNKVQNWLDFPIVFICGIGAIDLGHTLV